MAAPIADHALGCNGTFDRGPLLGGLLAFPRVPGAVTVLGGAIMLASVAWVTVAGHRCVLHPWCGCGLESILAGLYSPTSFTAFACTPQLSC